jgi:L-fuconolactonase
LNIAPLEGAPYLPAFMQTTRRAFLGQAALTATCAALPQFATAGDDAPLTVIDTHTHFYDPGRPQGVPWPNKNDALLHRTVLPKDYLALPVPQKVAGTVVVEASAWVEDNQWILDLAKENPFIVGFVGNLKPGEADFAANLKRFAANPLYRGIRIPAGSLREGLGRPEFVADLKRLADRDLSLDLNGPATALPDVARLAREIPTLRLVINHHANIAMDGKTVPDDWRRDLLAMAKLRNVFAKVSGLVEGASRALKENKAPTDTAFYRPYLDVTWEAFGPDRLVYGSNWPVSERFASLAAVQTIVTEYFSGKGRTALEKVFAGNAATAYKWVRR